MADLNKIFLIGRLTRDPELRYTPGGAAITDLGVATGRNWTTRDGEKKKETTYIDVTVWSKQAEHCCQYLKKGSQVHVEGYLKLDTWDDRNTGEKRSKLKVEAERVQFLDPPSGQGGGGQGEPVQRPPTAAPTGGYAPAATDDESDIPFAVVDASFAWSNDSGDPIPL